MNIVNKLFISLGLVIGLSAISWAYTPYKVSEYRKSEDFKNRVAQLREDCLYSTQQVDLSVNNVRARLLNGGDIWWDLENGRYIVPKVPVGSGKLEVSSLFAGAVWLGGYSVDGNLKVAAVAYRTGRGMDYYPGPLTDQGVTDKSVCDNWDQFFRVTGDEVREHFRLYKELGSAYTAEMIPPSVKYYPGAGNPFFAERYGFNVPSFAEDIDYYGYYWNVDNDPNYNPLHGDFPYIQVEGCTPSKDEKALEMVPDEMYFWIYNDNGGVHEFTNATPIQMEVQVQAFAYKTQDELNNMTFYRYRLINEAQTGIGQTYFAMWVDPDLGCPSDDFIGSDTTRSLMYVYNKDAQDGTTGTSCVVFNEPVPTYGDNIPMVGVDYFRGPLDTFGVELGMSSFTYYNNGSIGDFPDGMTDPETGQQVYFYLTGRWKDGSRVTSSGSGYNTGGEEVDYVFYDPPNKENGWSMAQTDIKYGDRRTIQASGPFFLKPGVVNELIVGVVWVPSVDHPAPALDKILKADDKAQGLFDNCFDILDGPDAPDVAVVELDRQAIFVLTNDSIESNNKFLSYEENILTDVDVSDLPTPVDTTYEFQGYRVYQLKSLASENTPAGRKDPSNARLVFQSDIKDGISKIFNWTVSADPSDPAREIAIPTLEVDGPNTGLRSSFLITKDQFTGQRLKNNTKYYYTVVAYAYNNYAPYPDSVDGQLTPYIEGRSNVGVYTVIPHQSTWLDMNAVYGQGFEVTKMDGLGTGGNFLNIAEGERPGILEGNGTAPITYAPGASPINLKVINPIDIQAGDYTLKVFDNNPNDGELDLSTARYSLINNTLGDTITTKNTLLNVGEFVAGEFGISVNLTNVESPGEDNPTEENGAVGESITYNDPSKLGWFGFYQEGTYADWIKTEVPGSPSKVFDPASAFSQTIMQGPFYPFILGTSARPNPPDEVNINPIALPVYYGDGEASMGNVLANATLKDLPNVDIVLTSDKSMWSRCVVLETHNLWYEKLFAGIPVGPVGGAPNMGIRQSPSVLKTDADGDGKADVDPNESRKGFGWFPGYAINVETGERLNIMFGENSMFNSSFPYDSLDVVKDGSFTAEQLNRGADMMWNPLGGVEVAGTNPATGKLLWYSNASHFIYVSNSTYDGCESIYSKIERVQDNPSRYARILRTAFSWVAAPNIPATTPLTSYAEGLIPDKAVISVRVDNEYSNHVITGDNKGNPLFNFTVPKSAMSTEVADNNVDSLLKHVVAVPNPYRGLSGYETDASQNIVKITNLPPKCTITIYSLDGKFIREYKVNESYQAPRYPGDGSINGNPGVPREFYNTIVEWDMRNNAGIPVSSGVYLIYIDAPGIGQKVIKWFGIHKKFDPSIF